MQTPAWSSVDHYENFPVASVLVPARLRPAVIALYRFARTADDIADEGVLAAAERLAQLSALDRGLQGTHPDDPEVVVRLRPFIAQHNLPVDQLRALLDAFAQDVNVTRYPDRTAVMDYCSRSANPIGRLLLRLFQADELESVRLSDRICTALQLINFLQDIAIDWRKGRVYLPQFGLAAAGSSDHDIELAAAGNPPSPRLLNVIRSEAAHARELLISGAPFIHRVPWRLSLELRAILAGGHRIIDRISQVGGDVFSYRPTLGGSDAFALLGLAIRPRLPVSHKALAA